MSNDQTPPETPVGPGSAVLKSDINSLLSGQSDVGMDGEFIWPIAPRDLALLYRSSAEHARAIHVKAESAFGGGMIGDGADTIEALCDAGASELFVALGLDLETYGNAFMQVIQSRDQSRIIGLRRLPAITMSRFRSGFLQRVSKTSGETKKITFTAREIVHLRVACPEGRHYALPTWIGAHGMLELAHAAIRYNASFFKNNAMPEYAVIFKGVQPSKQMKTDIQRFFRSEYQGFDNAHRTLILSHPEEGEITFERLTADVKDGDFLKLIDAARDRIPVAHGVPPRMLGIMSAGQLGGGGEVSGQLFIFEHLTLKPKRRHMLDQLRPTLLRLGLTPGVAEDGMADNMVAFRPLDLTPPKDDAENLPDLVSAGIITEDEARGLLPFLQTIPGFGPQDDTKPVLRSADSGSLDALAALLAKL